MCVRERDAVVIRFFGEPLIQLISVYGNFPRRDELKRLIILWTLFLGNIRDFNLRRCEAPLLPTIAGTRFLLVQF